MIYETMVIAHICRKDCKNLPKLDKIASTIAASPLCPLWYLLIVTLRKLAN